jgi:cytochrome c-type biogenesis protein
MKQNQPFKHAIAFVIGFGIVFTFLGISVGVIGRLTPTLLPAIQVLGGILLIAFGLVTVGLTSWISDQIRARPSWQDAWLGNQMVRSLDYFNSLVYADRRLQLRTARRGYLSSFLTGIVFSAGWAPCLGPILAAILLLASEQQTIAQGAFLMVVFTLGLAVPFLITAGAMGRLSGTLRKINQNAKVISLISGAFLIFTGWLLVSGRLLDVSTDLIYYLGFGFGLEEIILGSATISIPLAFFAGTLSFFSPCVLPLIPAYLGYMGSKALGSQAGYSETVEV